MNEISTSLQHRGIYNCICNLAGIFVSGICQAITYEKDVVLGCVLAYILTNVESMCKYKAAV